MENSMSFDLVSVNITLLLISSFLASVLIALIGDPKKKRFWAKLGDESSDNTPSIFLCLAVFAYFIIAFSSLNFLPLSFGLDLLICFIAGTLIGYAFLIAACISGLIISSLRQAFYFLAKPKRKNNSFRRKRFNRGLQFYFAIIAILMMSFWLFEAADENFFLASVPPLTFLTVLKISRNLKEIRSVCRSIRRFIGDFLSNDSLRVRRCDEPRS